MNSFTLEKINRLLPVLQAGIHRQSFDIGAFKVGFGRTAGTERVEFDDTQWPTFEIPGDWGGYDVDACFRTRVDIPEAVRGKKLALRFLVGPRDGGGSTAETMLYVNGEPLQAIDYWHEEAVLPPEITCTTGFHVTLKAWSGVYKVPARRRFKEARLVVIDEQVEALYFNALAVAQTIEMLDESDMRRVKLESALDAALQMVDFVRVYCDPFYSSVRSAFAYLQSELASLQRDELKPTVNAVGHSHIDIAWMWRVERTRQKSARTFTTMLNLMRQYPDFVYTHSSPQLYQFLRQDEPAIFDKVSQAVARGQWEVLGGSWVEMDTLLPSGEALVRQVLHGKKFTREVFGRECRVLWLPDSFGFTCILPTIMKAGGLEGFFTASISWSKFNRFPYDLFRWRGLDGSEVLVNFITTPAEFSQNYNYIGRLEPDDINRTWANNRQKAFTDEVLLPFGWGDGGGGPTVKMLEGARVMANLPGLPYVRMGTVEEYFQRLQQSVQGRDLPVVDGELYLEGSRGTYTSQARNKRANRKAEILLHNAECLGVLSGLLTGRDSINNQTLRCAWQKLLLNQFHDILSGTAITPVHQDSLSDYEEIQAAGKRVCSLAVDAISADIARAQAGVLVINTRGWKRSGVVQVQNPKNDFLREWLESVDGQPAVQAVGPEENAALLLWAHDIPAYGYRFWTLDELAHAKPAGWTAATKQSIENEVVCLRFNPQGQLVSIFHKPTGREVLPSGQAGNRLQLFEDRPVHGDAWNIDIYYQDKVIELGAPEKWEVEENGPLRAALRMEWNFNRSAISQRVVLHAGSARIDFETRLEWNEHHVLLKAAFPVDVRARRATYDAGFGSLERPTQWNTLYDAAHFENPAHQWVDLSESGFGAALLNDCKYGYDVKDNLLRISLHRSPTEPDAQADQGEHIFTYSLLPHASDWRTAGVVREGYNLNDALICRFLQANPSGELPDEWGFFVCPQENVVLDTIKPAEDGDGVVLRFFESHGERSMVSCRVGKALRRVVRCNLLEEEAGSVGSTEDGFSFQMQPFGLVSFKAWFA